MESTGKDFVRDHEGFGPIVIGANRAVVEKLSDAEAGQPVEVVQVYLTRMAREIHQANIDAGWWKREWIQQHDHPQHGFWRTVARNIGELLCLVHSEISEGFEGWFLSLPDDKLPHRPMIEVELADAAIRIFDILGYYGVDVDQIIRGFLRPVDYDAEFRMLFIHKSINQSMEGFRKGNDEKGVTHLVEALGQIIDLSIHLDLDLWTAIAEKREFNRHREDHKPENRAKAGGKQF